MYIQTHGNLTIDLLDPDPQDFVLGSLAFAIAHANRYAGHGGIYSVAEHSVLGTRALQDQGHGRGIQAGFLLHDLHEAVVGDVSAPVKAALRAIGQNFAHLEDLHQDAVGIRFRVNTRAPEVKAMDRSMCVAEGLQIFGQLLGRGASYGWPSDPPAPIKIRRWPGPRALGEFMDECARLEIV